jgi:hypothetical protein
MGSALIIDEDNSGKGRTLLDSSSDAAEVLFVRNSAAVGTGIAGLSVGDGSGVFGQGSTGVQGLGRIAGVRGIAYLTHGTGVFGSNDEKWKMFPVADYRDTTGVCGLVTETSKTKNPNAGDGSGVYGESDVEGDKGHGVTGYATASTGFTRGVYGQSDSSDGAGVHGYGKHIGVFGQASDPKAIPLVAQGADLQSANLQEWWDSNNRLSVIDKSGNLGVGTSTPTARIHGQATSVSDKPIVAQGVSGQKASLQEWQNSAGVPLSVIDRSGKLGVGTATPDASITGWATSGSTKVIVARGASLQLANLQEWQTSGGTPLSVIDMSGNLGVGTATPTARMDVSGSTGYNQLRMRTSFTPKGTATDFNGNAGDIAWDNNYLYVKTSLGWKRTALSTF